MNLMLEARRQILAKMLVGLFVCVTLLVGVAGAADAAPISKCRNNPENFSFFRGKCMSDRQIERLQERRHHRGEDRHHAGHR